MAEMYDIKRQQDYKQHRRRIQNATSLVDSKAPRPKPTSEELKKCTFLEMFEILTANSKEKTNMKISLKMEDLNKHLPFNRDDTGNDNDIKDSPVIPFHVRQRYDHLTFAQDWKLMQRLLRPCIYLDLLDIKGNALGRLVIQLFTEACPEVVLQFVRTCLAKKPELFHISRLVSPLWLEAELSFADKNALTSDSIEHDAMSVNHGSSAGIVSFPSRYLRGSKLHFLTFTISFTPINVLNGKRIAFGIVKCGHKVLERLQCFEVTRSGRPRKNVTVSACGVYY